MEVYKLFRKLKSGEITSLFINKTERLVIGKRLQAFNYPTKGYAVRHGWHCLPEPKAPHLSEKGRVWLKVYIEDYEVIQRPKNQGGCWYLAKYMTILD